MKPLLKWVGGKTQILDEVLNRFPKEYNSYHELFLGGGSVLFGLLDRIEKKEIIVNGSLNAYDLNPHLIQFYNHIKTNPDDFLKKLDKIKDKYRKITVLNQVRIVKNNQNEDITEDKKKKPKLKTTFSEEPSDSRESYYYWIRQEFNRLIKNDETKTSLEVSVYLLFMNKIGFRGVYRMGPNGFNVPFGNPKNVPQMVTKDEITTLSNALQNVNLYVMDFKESMKRVKEGDFMYLDPPYYPEQENSFVNYTGNGFNKEAHDYLFKLIKNKSKKNVKFLMSNSNTKYVTDSFKEAKYKIEYIDVKRAIHSTNPGAKTKEVFILNLILL